MTHPFEVLADPVRRRLIQVLAVGSHRAGELCEVVALECRISRSAVSHQLRTLRDVGAVTSEVDEEQSRSRRYRVNEEFLFALGDEVRVLFGLWDQRDDSAGTGGRARSASATRPPGARRFGAAAARRAEADAAAWRSGVAPVPLGGSDPRTASSSRLM
jgi:DNA-binding transcriptional ArsR family regulator